MQRHVGVAWQWNDSWPYRWRQRWEWRGPAEGGLLGLIQLSKESLALAHWHDTGQSCTSVAWFSNKVWVWV